MRSHRINSVLFNALLGVVVVSLFGCSSVPTPVMPDGSKRTPINSDAGIQNYQARTAEETASHNERTALARQVAEVNRQLAELKVYVAVLQSNQETGIRPTVQPINMKAPLTVSLAESSETLEVRDQAITFRITYPYGQTDFAPSLVLSDQLIKAAREARHIEIRGRTDAVADNPVDNRIAKQRALHARRYLISHGVEASKIRWNYLASGGNIAENKTPEGRAKNRRVEIEMMDMDTTAFNRQEPTRVDSVQ